MLGPVMRCISLYVHHTGSLRVFQHRRAGLLSSSSGLPSKGVTRHTSMASVRNMSVDITRENFQAMLPAVKEALEKCTFFAFDCEMTGLFTDGNKHEYLDDIQARYSKMTESSKAYIITQYGLSCFEATGPSSYEARTFNFYVFPQSHGSYNRRFLCDASSLAFLSAHGFDFNKCISQGVPYMPIRTRDFQLLQVNRSSEPREPVQVTSADDKAFVAELVQLVTDWLAGRQPTTSSTTTVGAGAETDGLATDDDTMGTSADDEAFVLHAEDHEQLQQAWEQLELPPMNSYKRLLAYQELRKSQFGVEGHPGFWVKKSSDSRCLVLIRATAQQAEQFEAEARAARMAAINEAAGFAAVFDLMRHSNKPAVGHNCMFDVAYGIYSFADSYLPNTWRDYKKMVCSWHPGGIWDTKYLSKRLPQVFEGNTSLAEVYSTLVEDGRAGSTLQLLQAASEAAAASIQLPTITHAPGFDKYRSLGAGEAAHEAGYDAYMTGAAFACLLPLIAGTIAADSSSEFATAYKAVQDREAAAAVARASRALAGLATPVVGAGQQRTAMPPSPLPMQQQHVHLEQQEQPVKQNEQEDQQQEQQQEQLVRPLDAAYKAGDLLQYAQGVRGRLNMTFTDMAYAALSEPDPIPTRPYTFHLSGLQPGYRADDIWRMLKRQGLGSVRITPLDSSSCLAEFQPEVVAAVPQTVADLNGGIIATAWAEYALSRYHHQVSEPDAASASAVAGDVTGRGVKRPRLEEQAERQQGQQQPQLRGAITRLHAARPEGDGREGSDSEDEPADDQHSKSTCRIM